MSSLSQTRCGDVAPLQVLPYLSAGSDTGTSTEWFQHCGKNIQREKKKHELTDKLWRPENVLELVPCFNLMSDPKVNQFDPGIGDVLIKQHDILGLKDF